MKQWLLSVAGIAILSVLCDVILPHGQTKKYIKTVIGVIVTLTMVQPIFSLLSSLGTSSTASQTDISVDSRYLSYVEASHADAANSIAAALISSGFAEAAVTFDAENLRYVAVLNEVFSEKYLATAQNAVQSVKSDCSIEFVWNG